MKDPNLFLLGRDLVLLYLIQYCRLLPLAKRALLYSLESLLQVKYPFLSFISRLGSLFDLSVEIRNLLFFLFRFLFKATEGYALILVSNLFGLEHALASSHALLDSRKSLVD